MTEQTEEKAPARAWQWPLEWWHDEKFWRDVATRTVSGLVVLLIGYIVAVASGLLGIPDLRKVLAVLLVFAGAALVVYPLGMLSRKIILWIKKHVIPKWVGVLMMTGWGLIYFVLLAAWAVITLNVTKWAYESI
ncbi:membrane protease YdiL (CAAX protease family) [Arthrobacter sp. B2I5]|uniref:hypothetical protein n=1 Tax=Arthrobacter sp. B2I5 TaxID=3042266 RepID=UPI00277EB3A3|nr:hypothetical protein [Arthrobacter sp. B2I5]MDQ0825394.1 membrane protease YdiL (CAAX protease family) [Arthrobacter sp. B2I5]